MITLTNGFPQGPNGLIVPNGSIKFQLNVDATIIAAPHGFVFANVAVTFQFDKNGALIQPVNIWSNEELQPQLSSVLLGTYYLVTFYDQNGALLNDTPLWWQFPNTIGSTVDISNMTPISTVGGNIIFYPTLGGGGGGTGTVTSVAFVGDGVILSTTPSTPVITAGNIAAALLTQSANLVLAGPTTGAAHTPTFRSLVTADLPAIAASFLSNGLTGTGLVVLATAPTINGLTFPTAAGAAVVAQDVVPAGTIALGTTLIASGAKSAIISVAATGVLSTDNVIADFNADPSGVTGYAPSASGMLTIIKWCSAGFINFYQYNNTASSITPDPVTLNYRVVR
jgi:hypothetical protein